MNNYLFWVITYIVFAVIFSQEFRKANRNMKNPSALTILLEVTTSVFAILFIPFFEMKISTNINIYIPLLIATIFYAIIDRLNIEVRYGLDPSVYSVLKQLSTVFLIIFAFFTEGIVLQKVIGALLIITANILLLRNSEGKFKINKYFIMSLISNLLLAISTLINKNISNEFNSAIYTILTVFIPAIYIKLFSRIKLKEIKEEFNRCNKKSFLIASFSWCVMFTASIKAYELGNITVVAPLLTLTIICNSIYEYFNNKDTKTLIYKLLISILIIIGIFLIKS